MTQTKISATISEKLLDWVAHERDTTKRFRNISHALDLAILQQKNRTK